MEQTIAAIATPPGEGGIAIIRISGSKAKSLLQAAFRPKQQKHANFPSHRLLYGHLYKGDEPLDEVMAVFMAAPNTYTREDVAEIHTHGGTTMATLAMDLLLNLGARVAEPGEFTKRAFMNGRLDLTQAEAVMGLISANGADAARVALRQLEGGASQFIKAGQETLIQLLSGLEAALDYPEEVDENEAVSNLCMGISQLAHTLESACDTRALHLLSQGLSVVLYGKPNVGKSSLLNLLTGEDRAIVTDIPGTTRDTLTGTIALKGVPVHITDTAGLRTSPDAIERLGIDRAKKALESADLALLIIDASQPLSTEDKEMLGSSSRSDFAVVLNKGDLPPLITAKDIAAISPDTPIFPLSAKEGNGLSNLVAFIQQKAMIPSQTLLTNQRHLDAVRRSIGALRQGAQSLKEGAPLDVVAIDLHEAIDALGEVTGDQVSEKILDAVFANFCVGK